ncbi:class I SAM-dependent methyltransferase [Shouchella patagoniensis]|uniref:class I SAM-dependent methyltransferase n=1 Tax=Shouchella patagoniensis TaxID=228576 RepID=UPI000995D72F|nr:class I SAM-dependent methyltransferase [Shouchella patagoniensis]
MIVTTARKQAEKLKQTAIHHAQLFQVPFIERGDRSLDTLFREYQVDVLIVAKNKLALYGLNEETPFFYHPNSSLLRYKQWKKTKYDPFIETAQLSEGDIVIDASLGMGADAVMAQLAVGKSGKVIGLEADHRIATIVAQGLQSWSDADALFIDAMRRIHVKQCNSLHFLKNAADNSADIVYFDPMFETKIDSPGLSGMRKFASYQPLSLEMVQEAKRVARRAVVLKDHYQSQQFKRFEFVVKRRQHAAFQYGLIVLDVSKKRGVDSIE